MADLDDDTLALLRTIAAERAARDPDHVPPPDLVAYVEGSLPGLRDDSVREHLATCVSCARAVLDLDELAKGGPVDKGADFEPDVDQGLQRLKAVAAGQAEPTVAAFPPPRARRPHIWPLAASLAAGSVLGLLGARVTSGPAGFRAQLVAADLAPRNAIDVRGPVRPDRVTVPAGSEHATLLLTLPVLPSGGTEPLTLEVTGAAGRVLWRTELRQAGLARTLLLDVPLHGQDSPAQAIRLRSAERAGGVVLAEYLVRIEGR